MSNYSVYTIDNPSLEDFASEIDRKRFILHARHFFENGHEVRVENYEGAELLSRTESKFNEQGYETETLEYIGNEEQPFKIITREFNGRGQLVASSLNYGDGEPLVDVNVYDPQGRLVQSTRHDEDDTEYSDLYTYEGNCPEPATHTSSSLGQRLHETKFVYVKEHGEYRLTEEHFTNSFDKFLSRITKYYLCGERPNSVVEEIFNSRGKLLEECRAELDFAGNVVKHSWHVSSDDDCEPFQYSVYEYDSGKRLTFAEHFKHGVRIEYERTSYDSQGRTLRDLRGLDPDDSLLIYEYET